MVQEAITAEMLSQSETSTHAPNEIHDSRIVQRNILVGQQLDSFLRDETTQEGGRRGKVRRTRSNHLPKRIPDRPRETSIRRGTRISRRGRRRSSFNGHLGVPTAFAEVGFSEAFHLTQVRIEIDAGSCVREG